MWGVQNGLAPHAVCSSDLVDEKNRFFFRKILPSIFYFKGGFFYLKQKHLHKQKISYIFSGVFHTHFFIPTFTHKTQIVQTASLAPCVCNINCKLRCAYTSLLVNMCICIILNLSRYKYILSEFYQTVFYRETLKTVALLMCI